MAIPWLNALGVSKMCFDWQWFNDGWPDRDHHRNSNLRAIKQLIIARPHLTDQRLTHSKSPWTLTHSLRAWLMSLGQPLVGRFNGPLK